MSNRIQQRSTWEIFRWPLLFTLLSLVGLIAALVGDGPWDGLSWMCLAAVVAAMFPAVFKSR
jgi:hypothetical protein